MTFAGVTGVSPAPTREKSGRSVIDLFVVDEDLLEEISRCKGIGVGGQTLSGGPPSRASVFIWYIVRFYYALVCSKVGVGERSLGPYEYV